MDLQKKMGSYKYNCILFITFQWLAAKEKEAIETIAETDIPRKEQITGLREQSLIVSIKICINIARALVNLIYQVVR